MFLCLCARAWFSKSRAVQLRAAVRETRRQCWKREQFCPDPVGSMLEQQPPLSSQSCSNLPFSPCCVELSSSVQSCSLCKQRETFSRELPGLFSCLESGDAALPVLAAVCTQQLDAPRIRVSMGQWQECAVQAVAPSWVLPLVPAGPAVGWADLCSKQGKEGRASTSAV